MRNLPGYDPLMTKWWTKIGDGGPVELFFIEHALCIFAIANVPQNFRSATAVFYVFVPTGSTCCQDAYPCGSRSCLAPSNKNRSMQRDQRKAMLILPFELFY